MVQFTMLLLTPCKQKLVDWPCSVLDSYYRRYLYIFRRSFPNQDSLCFAFVLNTSSHNSSWAKNEQLVL